MSAVAANAAVVTLDFDAVTDNAYVEGFYGGGTDSLGGSGTNYGMSFLSPNTVPASASSYGGLWGGYDPNHVISQFIVNVPAGFSGSVTFDWVDTSSGFGVKLYDDINGPLGSGTNFYTDDATPAGDDGTDSHVFGGTAKSLWVRHFGAPQARFDNIIFSNVNLAEPVPEPSTLVLAALGLAGLGLVAWRRRK